MRYYILSYIQIDSKEVLWPEWELFQQDFRGAHELHIVLTRHNQSKYGVEMLGEQPGTIIMKTEDCLLSINEAWTKAKLTVLGGDYYGICKLLNILLLTHLSKKFVLETHASLVNIKGKGLIFLGPSGIGKTTQAELWMKQRNAEIINGDRVFIKQELDCFLGCGSPWHGSSPYCLNKQVPLSALIVLKQSKKNSIRRLYGFEMVSSLMNSVFFPTWYKAGHEVACRTFDTLLRSVPVYELSCNLGKDAVSLVEETVFGKS